MRFAVAVAMLAWAALFSGPAAADLYRWLDPDSGSIKFSSYPPPWYGDTAKEPRAPKVEVIPDRSSAPSSGPKPEEATRPEPGSAAKPVDKSRARPVDTTPDGPAGKPAAKPAPEATKERSADAR